jgi:hypothetical protein
MRMTAIARGLWWFGCCALGLAFLTAAAPAANAAQASAATVPTACGTTGNVVSPEDVDADEHSDLVVGVPGASLGGLASTGAVDIHYGFDPATSATLRTQRFGETFLGLSAAAGDRFGAAATFANVDGNDCTDLVIGAPGVNAGAGAVVVALGSTSGVLSTGALVLHGLTAGERFGTTVRVAESDIWVSAPNRTVDGHPGAGAVDHFRVTGGAVSLVQRITEDSPNVPGVTESNDHFGSILGVGDTITAGGSQPVVPGPPRLYVGSPFEDVGSAVDAGTAGVLYQSASTGLVTAGEVVSQNSPGVGGTAESGDHFGAALGSAEPNGEVVSPPVLFVGVPDEALGSIRHAGIVQVFTISATHAVRQQRTIDQETPGVPGGSETGDRFGVSLAVGSGCQAFDPVAVAIGAPGESIGRAVSAGAVTLVAARPDGQGDPDACPLVFRQGAGSIGGAPESGDRFGTTIGELAQPYDPGESGFGHVIGGGAFTVGVPGEDLGADVDAGAVQILSAAGTAHDSSGNAGGEQYGAALASSVPNFSCNC